MHRRSSYGSFFLAVLYLAAALPVELHTDVLFSGGGGHCLVSHDCGRVERHRDLDSLGVCQACYRAENFSAVSDHPLPLPASFTGIFFLLQFSSRETVSVNIPRFLRRPPDLLSHS